MVAFDVGEVDAIADEGRFDLIFVTAACDAHNSQQNVEYCNLPIVVDPLPELNAVAVAYCAFEFVANAFVAVVAAAVDLNAAAAGVVALHVMTADLTD